jgi:ParB family transcriptional regulator, chromosome partitioning protein
MADWWEPTETGYLGRVSKARVLAAVSEAVSSQAAENIAKMKKGPMVTRAAELLADTRWLPEALRTPKAPSAIESGSVMSEESARHADAAE